MASPVGKVVAGMAACGAAAGSSDPVLNINQESGLGKNFNPASMPVHWGMEGDFLARGQGTACRALTSS